jgi:hypothetical protein
VVGHQAKGGPPAPAPAPRPAHRVPRVDPDRLGRAGQIRRRDRLRRAVGRVVLGDQRPGIGLDRPGDGAMCPGRRSRHRTRCSRHAQRRGDCFLMPVRGLTWVMVRPARRGACARSSPMLTARLTAVARRALHRAPVQVVMTPSSPYLPWTEPPRPRLPGQLHRPDAHLRTGPRAKYRPVPSRQGRSVTLAAAPSTVPRKHTAYRTPGSHAVRACRFPPRGPPGDLAHT